MSMWKREEVQKVLRHSALKRRVRKHEKIITGSPFQNFKAILKEWIGINKAFCQKFPKDCLYWYNERASLSTLAGAIWKTEGLCHEEFRIQKKSLKKCWNGRCDLWFTHREKEFYIEAKQIYVSLSERAEVSHKHINKALQSARKDVARIGERNGSEKTLGMVFIVPYLALRDEGHIEHSIEKLLDEIELVDYDIMAYTFPPNCRGLKYRNYIYPGVVLIGRAPRRNA